MQISSNYQSSPNFGMAMILEKGSRPALEKGGMKMVNTLKHAQEIVGNTKMVHLSIGEDAVPTVVTPFADKYTRYFSVSEPTKLNPEFLPIKTIWAGTELYGIKAGDSYRASINLGNAEAAKRAYTELATETSEILKAAKLTKILDDKYVAADAAKQAKMAEETAVKKELDGLFERFGKKDPVEI